MSDLRRYKITRLHPGGSGWAVVVLDLEIGYFSTVSDYGNYAFAWSAHGHDDFRSFLITLVDDLEYFAKKVAPGRFYNDERTRQLVYQGVCRLRSERLISASTARETWELVETYNRLDTEHDFAAWLDDVSEDVWEHGSPAEWASYGPNPRAVAYAQVVLPKLAEVLKAELEEEAHQGVTKNALDIAARAAQEQDIGKPT